MLNELEPIGREFRELDEEELTNYYTRYWTDNGTMPTTTEVALKLGMHPVAVANKVVEDKFRIRLLKRGLPFTKNGAITVEQFKAIGIITDPTIKGGLKERLKLAGISYAKYKNWMLDSEFRDSVNKQAEMILENNLSGVNSGLVNRAENGDIAAIKFYYEVTGRYNPNDIKTLDVMSILGQIVEILHKRVQDPELLEIIATDLSLLTTSTGLPVAPSRIVGR